ncbi:MAG: LysE/ArgO family amino acid transporter [Simkaniaceae bacterium]|nr:LysE/ArgO family amino acid transporter [Simkaniaceae bacterium]
MLAALFKGFSTSAGLIMAIGAQNAFVLKQGLMRRHLLATALVCTLIDGVLISMGTLGFRNLIEGHPLLINGLKYFAILFLFIYGGVSFYSIFQNKTMESENQDITLSKTLLVILSLSLLNPHVYLDTVVLIGSICSQLQLEDQPYFTVGAVAASFCWFFSLTYGSRLLSPFFKKPLAWKIIHFITGAIMWAIALTLI